MNLRFFLCSFHKLKFQDDIPSFFLQQRKGDQDRLSDSCLKLSRTGQKKKGIKMSILSGIGQEVSSGSGAQTCERCLHLRPVQVTITPPGTMTSMNHMNHEAPLSWWEIQHDTIVRCNEREGQIATGGVTFIKVKVHDTLRQGGYIY